MANNPITANARIYHGVTSAGNVDVVTLKRGYANVQVINRAVFASDGSTTIWGTCDRGGSGETQTSLTPTVAGADVAYIGSSDGSFTFEDDPAGPPSVVRLMSTSPAAYTVIGI